MAKVAHLRAEHRLERTSHSSSVYLGSYHFQVVIASTRFVLEGTPKPKADDAPPGHSSPDALLEMEDGYVCVPLDALSHAALRVLIANGTSVEEAVRMAIVNAAERHPEPPSHGEQACTKYANDEEQRNAMVDTAPPFTEYQAYVLTSVFVEKRRGWLSEDQWLADRAASPDAPPSAIPTHGPEGSPDARGSA